MSYFEVKQWVSDVYSFEGPLYNNYITTGQINGREAEVKIIDQDTTTINNVVCKKEGGAVIFDPEKGLRGNKRVIVYSNVERASRLKALREIGDEDLGEILTSLYKEAYKQAGLEPPKMTLSDRIKDLPKYVLAIVGAS